MKAKDIFREYLSLTILSNVHDLTLSLTDFLVESRYSTTTFQGVTAGDSQSFILQIGLDMDLIESGYQDG